MEGNKKTLHPGDLMVSVSGEVLTTLLGSCVAVCVFDQKMKVGGMNHFLLAEQTEKSATNKGENLNRFGTYAIPNLLREFKRRGSQPTDLFAWVIGGADGEHSSFETGRRNWKSAVEVLSRIGINHSARAVGGQSGRQVEFDTRTGEVRCRPLRTFPEVSKSPRIEGPRKPPVRVLVVEDSIPVQTLLKRTIAIDPELELVGIASNSTEADQIRAARRPDVISLDLHLPGEDGVSYVSRIMKSDPTPTLIVTGVNKEDSGPVVQALEAGAFDWLQKPSFDQMNEFTRGYIERLKIGARLRSKSLGQGASESQQKSKFSAKALHRGLIAIGASTGGTEAIKTVLLGLPSEIPPTLLVQHMPPHFTRSFAERLNELCPFEVLEATQGVTLAKNRVLLAPGGLQMRVVAQPGGVLAIDLTNDPPMNLFKPSIDYLFESLVAIEGRRITAVLLTGMGSDGAKGLLKLKKKESWTIAQDEATCVVFGMPKAAIELGAASETLPLFEISKRVVRANNGSRL